MDSFEATLILLFSYHCASDVDEVESHNVLRTVTLAQPYLLTCRTSRNEKLAAVSERFIHSHISHL
jgi:hypothetical protein